MIPLDHPSAICQHVSVSLDTIVGRQTACRLAEGHAPAAGMDAYAQRFRGFQNGFQAHIAALGKEVEVIVRRGAAGEQQFTNADHGRRFDGFIIYMLPALVELGEPSKQRHVLNAFQTAGQCLVEVMVRIDQTGND